MQVDGRTLAFRVVHLGNLEIYLQRGALHAARHWPDDGLEWTRNDSSSVQERRAEWPVPCGPGGVLHDYIPFHLGPRNVFLLNLITEKVPGYRDGQEPLVTLVIGVEDLMTAHACVFTDGFPCVEFTEFFDDPDSLPNLPWESIETTDFRRSRGDVFRQKRAELLVHEHLPWTAILGIAVCNTPAKERVEALLARYPDRVKPVAIRPQYYFDRYA